MSTFDKAFTTLVGHEGGFQRSFNDRGNWTSGVVGVGELKGTKYGISAMSYPSLDIENLTLDQAKEIYKRDWWDAMKCDEMPEELAFQVFDGAVNSGRGNAVRWLQRAVGVVDDGYMGPVTLGRVRLLKEWEVVLAYNLERLKFLTKISTFNEYGRGWVRRVVSNLSRLVKEPE